MKQISISIPGFTSNTTPDDKPAVCVFAEENCGKTRFACTMPHENGVIGALAIDKNAKRTIDVMKAEYDLPIIVNEKPFLTDKEAIKLAMKDSSIADDLKYIKETYSGAVQRVIEFASRLVESPDVESIFIDTGDQLFDWILFSHFGRRNQIESFQRGAPNQDMIDFVNMMRSKNFCMINRATEIWKETTDEKGKKKSAPVGKNKPSGFGKIGGFMTATVELFSRRGVMAKDLEGKYRIKVQTCKGNTLLEGTDLGDLGGGEAVSGEAITWDNLMEAIGVSK